MRLRQCTEIASIQFPNYPAWGSGQDSDFACNVLLLVH